MPQLAIRVVSPPSEFGPYGQIRLVMPVAESFVEPAETTVDSQTFIAEFDWKQDKSGNRVAAGKDVRRESDGRRFVYLAWLENTSGQWQMFRRIKVYFDTATDIDADREVYSVSIRGTGPKQDPACARAVVLGP